VILVIALPKNTIENDVNAPLGAGYTSNLVRAICCKSQMRFGVSAIWCPTRITFYLFFAPNCRCNLVYLRFGVRFRVRVCFAAVLRVNLNKKGTEFIESI
jgi:hypothetical protein